MSNSNWLTSYSFVSERKAEDSRNQYLQSILNNKSLFDSMKFSCFKNCANKENFSIDKVCSQKCIGNLVNLKNIDELDIGISYEEIRKYY